MVHSFLHEAFDLCSLLDCIKALAGQRG
jgi:hypothetical protein